VEAQTLYRADVKCGEMSVEGDAWFSAYAVAKLAVARKAVLMIHDQGEDIEVPQGILEVLEQQKKGNTKAPASHQPENTNPSDPNRAHIGNIPRNNQDSFSKINGKKGSWKHPCGFHIDQNQSQRILC
jgi:hypothetical protein